MRRLRGQCTFCPDLVEKLSDREVAMRWLALTARPACRENPKIRECQIGAITSQPQRVAELRARLSDISWFVRLMCQTVARQCNIEDKCSGRFFEERFKLHRLENESDVLACMAYVDLNPLRAGMVDSLDDPAAQVSIGERLRGFDDQQVDPSSWLAPLELASEVDGQPVAVVNDLSSEEIERRCAALAEKLGCLPMTLEAYCQLLWHLAIESRPELQSSPRLTAAQLRKPAWASGTSVELDDVTIADGAMVTPMRRIRPRPRVPSDARVAADKAACVSSAPMFINDIQLTATRSSERQPLPLSDNSDLREAIILDVVAKGPYRPHLKQRCGEPKSESSPEKCPSRSLKRNTKHE